MAIALDLLGLYCLLTHRETACLGEAKKTMYGCMCMLECEETALGLPLIAVFKDSGSLHELFPVLCDT